MGLALREGLAGALGLDLWIGLPDAEHSRVAEAQKPKGLPDFGEPNLVTRVAFLTSWSTAAGPRRGRMATHGDPISQRPCDRRGLGEADRGLGQRRLAGR